MACRMSSPSGNENNEDSRGFLQAGDHHKPPEMTWVDQHTSKQSSSHRTLSMSSLGFAGSRLVSSPTSDYKPPPIEIHPRELDLDDQDDQSRELENTLVAKEQTLVTPTGLESQLATQELAKIKERSLSTAVSLFM